MLTQKQTSLHPKELCHRHYLQVYISLNKNKKREECDLLSREGGVVPSGVVGVVGVGVIGVTAMSISGWLC